MSLSPPRASTWIGVIALVIAGVIALGTPARAQGGYTIEKHPDLGLTFPRARDYEQLPTQPDEAFVVLDFVEKLPPKDSKAAHKAVRPEMMFVWIDFVPDPPSKGPEGSTVAPAEGGDTKPPKDGEPKAPKPPINSLERFLDQRLSQWQLGREIDGKPKGAYSAREYALIPKKGTPAKGRGWVYAYTKQERTVALIGFAGEEEIQDQIKIWRPSAERLEIAEPEEQSTLKLEQHYAHTRLVDPEFRIKVRAKLVHGWQAEDLDDYIVISHTPDQPLLRKVFRDVELLRKEYEKLFPPEKPVTAVSTVRVCKDRPEYLAYSGLEGTAGFWNSDTEELVLYDAEKEMRDHKKNDADTFVILYHEAFHQFIHYSAGELPPHSWFNEGHGDYFSGATIRDGKVRSIGVNPWRIQIIQAVIAADKQIPWREIVKYEQSQYYDKDKVHICYAQGWSMIYFLRKSKDVEKKPAWAKILPTYFEVLKRTWAEELAKLEVAGKKDDKPARWQAGLAARTKALDEAFKDVDFGEIERSWKAFTMTLEPPDPRK
jgi:hypothetical protein